MNVPLLDLKRQYQSIKTEIDQAVARVIESGQFIMGSEVEDFERAVAEYLGVTHAMGVASGTDALYLSLCAAGIGPGDKVIVPAFTFFATAGAVSNVGAIPLFCDIEPETFNLDVSDVRRILESGAVLRAQVKAIIPVHLYGQPADMAEVMALAEEFGLVVIEDTAQAIGAKYGGQAAGTIGNLGCFSFFPAKNLGAYGDGGLVVSNDDELADDIQTRRLHGSKPKYYHHFVGNNSRLDAIQAAILGAKLPHLDAWSRANQEHAVAYDSSLAEIRGIVPPILAPNRDHVYHQYTIRVKNGRRDALQEFLKTKNVGSSVYYPLGLDLQPCFAELGHQPGGLPETERACQEVLSIPIFPEMTVEERDYVVEQIFQFPRQ